LPHITPSHVANVNPGDLDPWIVERILQAFLKKFLKKFSPFAHPRSRSRPGGRRQEGFPISENPQRRKVQDEMRFDTFPEAVLSPQQRHHGWGRHHT
jgi:hypothetical protein